MKATFVPSIACRDSRDSSHNSCPADLARSENHHILQRSASVDQPQPLTLNEVPDPAVIRENGESNRPQRIRSLKRRATTEQREMIYVDKNEKHAITVGGMRYFQRRCRPVMRLAYIKCVVCKGLKVMSTNLQSSMCEGYICSIDCLNHRA